MPGFCHEAVVFGAPFSDARFTPAWAMRVGITGDGLQHFLNSRGALESIQDGSNAAIADYTFDDAGRMTKKTGTSTL